MLHSFLVYFQEIFISWLYLHYWFDFRDFQDFFFAELSSFSICSFLVLPYWVLVSSIRIIASLASWIIVENKETNKLMTVMKMTIGTSKTLHGRPKWLLRGASHLFILFWTSLLDFKDISLDFELFCFWSFFCSWSICSCNSCNFFIIWSSSSSLL